MPEERTNYVAYYIILNRIGEENSIFSITYKVVW